MIEKAKRAGQAVLQYQEHQAKQFDANRQRAQSETNQMFADQGRVLWNAGVNVIEGTINQGIDAALSKGGQDAIYNNLPEQAKPHVDFSAVKPDYQSEMMRRDINGKVDGDGIKMGQAVEIGVTIAAPFVVGAAVAPEVAPQSLKSLGGIPEAKTSATVVKTAAQNVAKVGQLGVEEGRTLSVSEKRFADKMVAEGKNVKAPKEVNQYKAKNPDFHIDNETVEFKYVSDLKGTNADKLSGGLSRRILDGGSQASKVSLDVTDQAGMTKDIAERGIMRAFGNQNVRGTDKLQEVRIYGKDFDITLKYEAPK